ncbi:oxygenase MpaB family protein [Zhongshania sp.]|jgi:hypothetical protein|uniref:oxygenase MpaB family protein n=1 Tax=Zhongshania sp. TaxID=1971902 RepID=UPI002A8249EC|nr:oxygenase MpaB family protein [Zhongshania sp.]
MDQQLSFLKEIKNEIGSDFPSRFMCDIEKQFEESAGLRKLIKDTDLVSKEDLLNVADSMLIGDEPMDRLVEWMFDNGFRENKALFDQAASQGIATIENPPKLMLDFFELVENTPDWVSDELNDLGAECISMTGTLGSWILRDISLAGGYRLSAVNQTLLETGALAKGAGKRLSETAKWWLSATRIGAMKKFAKGYVDTLQVRFIHSMVRRNIAKKETWDASVYGLPINQSDMCITYHGFTIVYLIGVQVLGVPLTSEQKKSLLELWRYISWLMGVDERFLSVDEETLARDLYVHGLTQQGANETSKILAGALKDEPLEINYGRFNFIRKYWYREVHLSITRAFVGKKGMLSLGLPPRSSWYLMLTTIPRYVVLRSIGSFDKGRKYLVKRGGQNQIQSGLQLDARK